jgi:5-(carboxyamino)imidazole ribonucleotide synthase
MSLILPGSTIGVLGGGQLGRMFAMAARRLGYRVHTLAPDHDTPTGQIADLEINASYDDLAAVRAFAQAVDVVTFEFENVSAAAIVEAEQHAIVRPNGRSLAIAQHRLKEKSFLAEHGLPVAPFAPVRTDADLAAAIKTVGCPSVLKTATSGYDGKGQILIAKPGDLDAAWTSLGRREAVLEAFLDLDREISVMGARRRRRMVALGPIERARAPHPRRRWRRDVPRRSRSSRGRHPPRDGRARFRRHPCIEFFITRDGRLVVNELPPGRTTGHLTFDACRPASSRATARGLRSAARLAGNAPTGGGYGEFTRRHLGRRGTQLGSSARHAGRQAAPVRQVVAQTWPQDGPPDGSGRFARESQTPGLDGAGIAFIEA